MNISMGGGDQHLIDEMLAVDYKLIKSPRCLNGGVRYGLRTLNFAGMLVKLSKIFFISNLTLVSSLPPKIINIRFFICSTRRKVE